MSKKQLGIRVFALMILLVVAWGIFFVFRFLFEKPGYENSQYLPKDVEWLLRIDGEELFGNALESILFEAKDNPLARQMLEEMEERELIGVNVFSEHFLFEFSIEGNKAWGMSLNLNAPDQFDQNCPKFFPDHVGFARHGNVGIVLFCDRLSREKLTKIAGSMEPASDVGKPYVQTEHTIGYWSGKSHIYLDVKNANINISAHLFDASVGPSGISSHAGDGFHMHSGVFPDFAATWLSGLLDRSGTYFPKINGFSIDYSGLFVASLSSSEITPMINSIVYFSDSLDFKKNLLELKARNLITHLTDSTFEYVKTRYYFSQYDPSTIYVGAEPPGNLKPEEHLIAIKGDPVELLEFESGMIVGKLIRLSGVFQSARRLAESIEEIDIYGDPMSGESVVIRGTIGFRDGEAPGHALTRFLLGVGIL